MSIRWRPTPTSAEACPGIRDLLRPTMRYVKCQACGGSVEIWSDEDTGVCLDCGAEWAPPDRKASCLEYCEYADNCREIIRVARERR